MAQILDSADNGDYAIVNLGGISWFTIDLSGTFDTADVTVTISTDGSSYHAFMPDGIASSWTAANNLTFHYGSCKLKFTVANGNGSEAIDLWVNGPNVLSTETTAV